MEYYQMGERWTLASDNYNSRQENLAPGEIYLRGGRVHHKTNGFDGTNRFSSLQTVWPSRFEGVD